MRLFRIQYASQVSRASQLKPCAPTLLLSGMSWNMPYNHERLLEDCRKRWGTVIVAPEPFASPLLLHEWRSMTRFYDARLLYRDNPTFAISTQQVAFVLNTNTLEQQLAYWRIMKHSVCVVSQERPHYTLPSHVKSWIYSNAVNAATYSQDKAICASNPYDTPGYAKDAWLEFPIQEDHGEGATPELASAATGINPYRHV